MSRRRMLLAVPAAVAAVLGSAIWIGSRRQHRALSAQVDRVLQAAAETPPTMAAPEPDGLPAPVARYLRWSLAQTRSIGVVRMRQAGTLRTDVQSDRWMPFEAEHIAAPDATGFVWNARVAIAPLLHVRVRDSYVGGRGAGHVSLLSAFTVGGDAGTPEMASGSLHRFLAEAVWYPSALRPSSKLQWSPIDAGRALATLTDRGVSVSLEFRFAETGEVTGIYTPARWGTFGGGYEQRPWEGHFRKYEERDGILVPTEGDVGWYVDGEWRPVWRAAITAFEVRGAG